MKFLERCLNAAGGWVASSGNKSIGAEIAPTCAVKHDSPWPTLRIFSHAFVKVVKVIIPYDNTYIPLVLYN